MINYQRLQDAYCLLCESIRMRVEAGEDKESQQMQKLLWSAEKLRQSTINDWDNYKQYIRPTYKAFIKYL